jgi:transcriptional regulator with XRE-family HTH domain
MMSDTVEPNVGLRIRSFRERQGLSLRAVADRCGLSINAISQIERGENSPTVSTLHRLAMALNLSITDFFNQEAAQTFVFVKQNQGLSTNSDHVFMESLGIGLRNQQIEPFRMIIQPGSGSLDDPVSHSGEEFIHCMKGEIDYLVGENTFHLEQGDSLLFEATQQHAYHNATSEPATVLIIFLATHDRQLVRQLHL